LESTENQKGNNMKSIITFGMHEEGMRLAAVFIAQLVREGVAYYVHSDNISMEITLTGGF
jgi:hypothetical protein